MGDLGTLNIGSVTAGTLILASLRHEADLDHHEAGNGSQRARRVGTAFRLPL
jgi:hypothetical protein